MKGLLSNTLFLIIAFLILNSCSDLNDHPVQSIEKSIYCIAQPGFDPNATLKCGVRYKSFNSGNDKEIYLGDGLLNPEHRTEFDFYNGLTCDSVSINGTWVDTNYISFSYSPSNGTISTQVNCNNNYCSSYQTGNLGKINYIQITIANRSSGTSVKLKKVKLFANGTIYNLGDFSSNNWNDWMVNSVDLTNGFSIEGKIILSGTQPNGELNKVQILVGDTTQDYSGFIVQPGWNCIAIPRLAQWMHVDSLLPSRVSSYVYKYDPTFKYYSSVDQLENGFGYFVEFPTVDTLKIPGEIVTSPVNLKSGWNLIGIYEKNLALSQISSNPPDIISSAFIRFDAINKVYTFSDTLNPGTGYWVESSEDGNLVFDNADNINTSLSEYYPKKDWSTITFKDSKGRKSILYFASKIDSKKFSMPPIFPEADFDVRFEDGSFASDLLNKKSVKITSSNYPILISVNGSPLQVSIPESKTSEIISGKDPFILKSSKSGRIILNKY